MHSKTHKQRHFAIWQKNGSFYSSLLILSVLYCQNKATNRQRRCNGNGGFYVNFFKKESSEKIGKNRKKSETNSKHCVNGYRTNIERCLNAFAPSYGVDFQEYKQKNGLLYVIIIEQTKNAYQTHYEKIIALFCRFLHDFGRLSV